MVDNTYSVERDLREAASMADGLADYVRQDQLYGSTGGGFFGGSMPSLTVGALLLRLRRLQAYADKLTPQQRQQLDAVQTKHDSVYKEWRRHYDEKMVREAHSRLDAMRTFFEECGQSMRNCAANYLPEALRRTIVQELADRINDSGIDSNDLDKKMKATDARLRQFARARSNFVWDNTLSDAYPQARYWWLYSLPQAEME